MTDTKQINTGGAAFPRPCGEASFSGNYEQDGMTLRDYFAAKAMQAIIEADGIQYTSATDAHAKWAYDQAAAMLAAHQQDAVGYKSIQEHLTQRAEAAEAKLAQIKAQVPVGYLTYEDLVWLSDGSFSINKVMPRESACFNKPLYTAPITNEDLKATNELLNAAIDDYNKEKAKVEVLREALEALRSDCQSPIDMYERNGPEFTSSQGNEYESTSYVVDKFSELVASIDTALAATEVKP